MAELILSNGGLHHAEIALGFSHQRDHPLRYPVPGWIWSVLEADEHVPPPRGDARLAVNGVVVLLARWVGGLRLAWR